MRLRFTLILVLSVFISSIVFSQNAGINDDNSNPDHSAQLDIKSTSRGLLIPRMTQAQRDAISSPAASLLIYQTNNEAGYYYYNGITWVQLETGYTNITTKSSSTTLTKTENYILASNNITLRLPSVSAADDGLEITVKNIGACTDLVVIKPENSHNIDGNDSCMLTRWRDRTYMARNTNWVVKNRELNADPYFEVAPTSSWQTIPEVLGFLEQHMNGPAVVRLGSGTYDISATQVIDLPYHLTFQGLTYGTSVIESATGLAGKPMFRCISECNFKMLVFDATTLSNYGTSTGEDAIRFIGANTYNEIKDCTFDRFYNSILDSSNAEIWMFECDISNAQRNGVLIHSNQNEVKFRLSETDFIQCRKGINMSKGNNAIIQMASAVFLNEYATDTAIIYKPSTFNFDELIISGNSYNKIGKFVEGFDFTRTDGRDANAFLEDNPGMEDKNPHCKINLVNNTSTTSTGSINTWYKVNWTGQSSYTCNWTINNSGAPNRITYQPINRRDVMMWISGNVSNSSTSQRDISLAIVKNGVTSTRFGETTVRATSQNVVYQFSTVVYISDVSPNDYFELFVSVASSAGSNIIVSDLNWLVNTQ